MKTIFERIQNSKTNHPSKDIDDDEKVLIKVGINEIFLKKIKNNIINNR